MTELYSATYFQGGKTASNYDDYAKQALGPSRMLAEELVNFFRPQTALDAGCALGFTVKRLRQLGVKARGIDISKWAVRQAFSWHIRRLDFSVQPIKGEYDLVFSYDVIEHVPPDRLDYAIRNLWHATRKHMLIVPAVYHHGETHDPGEPTHTVFKNYRQWVEAFEAQGCRYDAELTASFNKCQHTRVLNYTNRVIVFSKDQTGLHSR